MMRCPRDGRYMQRLTPTGKWWICATLGCKELRSSDPGTNFGLMLLGFTSKAAVR